MPALFFWIAAGTLISEDLACIGAGVLIMHKMLSWTEAIAACALGIFFGDLLLYLLGRTVGGKLLDRPWFARRLPPSKIAKASEWLTGHGVAIVLLSRFTPGLRLPTYFAAGLLRISSVKFATALLLAALLWTPLLVGAAALLGEQFAGSGAKHLFVLPLVVIVLLLSLRLLRELADAKSRQKLVARFRRILQWEFWPPWLAYLPLVPYFLWLAVRYRSLTVYTAANPAIPTGGLLGESKSAILTALSPSSGAVPAFVLIRHQLCPEERREAAAQFLASQNAGFPVVLKPDVGERGDGVVIAHTDSELRAYLETACHDAILQRYVVGEEFGVVYVREPQEAQGRILSITEKRFPTVVGDGVRTLEQLILADRRASLLADAYARVARLPLDTVPAAGQRVPLVEIGSHCRGAIFLDATGELTPALTHTIDMIAKSFPGFHLGRFDLRAPSRQDFLAGRSLAILELNGIGGEPAHIYDPAVNLPAAYRALARQMRLAFSIGDECRRQGACPLGWPRLLATVRAHFRRQRRGPKAMGTRAGECPSVLPTIASVSKAVPPAAGIPRCL